MVEQHMHYLAFGWAFKQLPTSSWIPKKARVLGQKRRWFRRFRAYPGVLLFSAQPGFPFRKFLMFSVVKSPLGLIISWLLVYVKACLEPFEHWALQSLTLLQEWARRFMLTFLPCCCRWEVCIFADRIYALMFPKHRFHVAGLKDKSPTCCFYLLPFQVSQHFTLTCLSHSTCLHHSGSVPWPGCSWVYPAHPFLSRPRNTPMSQPWGLAPAGSQARQRQRSWLWLQKGTLEWPQQCTSRFRACK